MLNIFCLLEKFYFEYEKTFYLKVKINLINKIYILENKVLKNMNSENILLINHILNNFEKKSEFILSRYLFFLSQIDIPEEYMRKIIEIYLNILSEYKQDTEKKEIILYSIKGLEKFSFENFEDLIIKLEKYPLFFVYKKELIILLGKTKSSIKSINFLTEKLKIYPALANEIYWSIGMIAGYKKFPMVKRKLMNDYIKKKIRTLKSNKKEIPSMLYFSLIEIFFIQNGIEGKNFNNLLETLHKKVDKNILRIILIKVINNSELTLEEKNMILDIENKF